jgi:hypothetical protein
MSNTTQQVPAASGKWGIADANGIYTFYSTWALAVAAATSGQCIELFGDITETTNTTCILKDGVNINGRGHTYTLSASGTASCFSDNGVKVASAILNLGIQRIGGTSARGNSLCLLLTGTATNIVAYGSTAFNNFGFSVYINGASIVLTGLYARGFAQGITNDVASSKISYCRGEAYGASNTYGIYTNGIAEYCTGVTSGGGAYAGLLVDTGGSASFCTGTSSISKGIESAGKLYQCYAFSNAGRALVVTGGIATSCTGYSTASDGINNTATCIGCIGISTANYGIIDVGGAYENCSAYSTVQAAMTLNGGWMKGGTVKCGFNDPTGHGIVLTGAGVTGSKGIFGVGIETVNTSANSIYSIPVSNTIKYGLLSFWGNPTTPVNASITQGQINLLDTKGNIKLG